MSDYERKRTKELHANFRSKRKGKISHIVYIEFWLGYENKWCYINRTIQMTITSDRTDWQYWNDKNRKDFETNATNIQVENTLYFVDTREQLNVTERAITYYHHNKGTRNIRVYRLD